MQPTTNQTMPTSLNELDLFISREYGYLNDETDNATWAVYSRLSRVDPNHHGYSLEIQPDRAEEYARSHGATKIEVYSDPDRTGRNSRRMELQRMMKDIRAGRVQIVVVHRLDRLYRNLESLLKFVRFLKRYREIADWLNSNDITLPDRQTVRFKTKGQTASNPDSLFSRESIRAIMENPFFAGLVARYERPELDKESILAYYLSEEGISAFERENFNLRQSMNRFRNLYQQGDIGLAEYEEQKQFIEQRLKALKPSSRAGAQDALTLLMNLPAELSKITSGEKRLLSDVIFKGLYFDSQGKLRKIMAHPPFDELLGLEDL